jgi:hypothetical protein
MRRREKAHHSMNTRVNHSALAVDDGNDIDAFSFENVAVA